MAQKKAEITGDKVAVKDTEITDNNGNTRQNKVYETEAEIKTTDFYY